MNDLERPTPSRGFTSENDDDEKEDGLATVFEEGPRLVRKELRIPARMVKAQEGVRRGLDLVSGPRERGFWCILDSCCVPTAINMKHVYRAEEASRSERRPPRHN